MLEVISQKDFRMQIQYLKEVYEWYFNKLNAMGALSKEEAAAEHKCLNPMTDLMADAMKKIVRQKMQSSLVNEDEQREEYVKSFDKGYNEFPPRSSHPSIAPASQRIRNFKVKSCGRSGALLESVTSIRAKDDELYRKRFALEQSIEGYKRGIATASIGSVYDLPPEQSTAANSDAGAPIGSQKIIPFATQQKIFERTERASKKLPFKTFYTTNLTEDDV